MGFAIRIPLVSVLHKVRGLSYVKELPYKNGTVVLWQDRFAGLVREGVFGF
jgi:hypothetical protein